MWSPVYFKAIERRFCSLNRRRRTVACLSVSLAYINPSRAESAGLTPRARQSLSCWLNDILPSFLIATPGF